ncbi:hypothetical protein Tco_1577007 [Tanacetum coccineum]
MSTLTFADTHNMVTFLEKPTESDRFHEIIDFLNANQIGYALTINLIIYTSCIQQFWAKANTVNGEHQIQALINKKKVIITESSIRSDIRLEDTGGTDYLPTATIFEELARMGDPPLSGEDSMQLSELMILCTNLQKHVLDLEKAKDTQAKEIADLKKRDKDSLGDHEDASKQGRSIKDIDKDANVSLVDDTQERSDDVEMFDTDELHGDEVVVDMLVGEKQKQSVKERETLIQIKAAKPKVVTTTATTTTTRPKARGVVVQEPSKFRTPQESQPSMIKDKCKAIMIEPQVPLKRKDQVDLDEDVARNLQA